MTDAIDRHVFPTLPDAEIRELIAASRDAARPEADRRAARHAVAEANMRSVIAEASRMCHGQRGDAIGWGTLGLMNAIDLFDLARPIKFHTYALLAIRRAISDNTIGTLGPVRIKPEAMDLARTDSDLPSAVAARRCLAAVRVSLGEEDSPEPIARPDPAALLSAAAESAEEVAYLLALVDDPRDRAMLAAHIGAHGPAMTYAEIGERWGCTRQNAQLRCVAAAAAIRVALGRRGVAA